jgi:hypothetical protein
MWIYVDFVETVNGHKKHPLWGENQDALMPPDKDVIC